MTVAEIVAASAASPGVFKPYAKKSVDGQEMELVDGGVACANPTLYAFNMAKNLYGYKNVRILSLGSTHEPFLLYKPSAFSKASKYINNGAMTTSMMAYTTDYFLSYNEFSSIDPTTKAVVMSDDFIRVDGVGSKMEGDITSEKNIGLMTGDADGLWKNNTE